MGHTQQEVRVVRVSFLSPQDRNGADVFGLHYDEARVVWVADPDPMWATLSRR